MEPMVITAANFEEEVLKSEKPVLIDFWADWCGPCKMLSPVIDQIANENEDIKVGKINVDDEGELAMKFQVASIPTLIAFKGGEIAGRTMGVQGKDEILALVK